MKWLNLKKQENKFKIFKTLKSLLKMAFKDRQRVIAELIAVMIVFNFYLLYSLHQEIKLVRNDLIKSQQDECDYKTVIKKIKQSVVRVVGSESDGSGFAINSQGLIITNFHVIEFEPSPKIIFPDNTFETGEIIMADKDADLAIIKIKRQLPAIIWADLSKIEPGDDLIVIGFAAGSDLPGEASVSWGSVSGRRHFKNIDIHYIQTDISLVRGVSGGPAINICGQVVGVNTMGTAGLGLAISADSVKEKLIEMEKNKNPLKDVAKITFQPNRSPLDAVSSFYNYLKIRKLDKAFALLSKNFTGPINFEQWQIGYTNQLDTTVFDIKEGKRKNFVDVKLVSTDLVGQDIIYRYFMGSWEVKKVNDKLLLWDANIKEVNSYDDLYQ